MYTLYVGTVLYVMCMIVHTYCVHTVCTVCNVCNSCHNGMGMHACFYVILKLHIDK
jgi:hypothetical protein